jgi:hypothetical protein
LASAFELSVTELRVGQNKLSQVSPNINPIKFEQQGKKVITKIPIYSLKKVNVSRSELFIIIKTINWHFLSVWTLKFISPINETCKSQVTFFAKIFSTFFLSKYLSVLNLLRVLQSLKLILFSILLLVRLLKWVLIHSA